MATDQDHIKGKNILITGGGRGIGRLAAKKLAAYGANIIVCSRTKSQVESLVQEIREENQSGLAFQCDVTKNNNVMDMVRTVEKKWGAIDILINNAGMGLFKKIVDTTESDWDTLLANNAKSAFLCSQAVLPRMMEQQQGHIVNVISVAGQQPYDSCGAYCASKFAMMGFSQVLRLETRKHNIKVTDFMPGATNTEIWKDSGFDRGQMMQPEPVADSLVQLCLTTNIMVEKVLLRPVKGDL